LLGGDFLEASEEDVDGGVGTGDGGADPAQEGAKKWIARAGVGDRQAQRAVGAAKSPRRECATLFAAPRFDSRGFSAEIGVVFWACIARLSQATPNGASAYL
jgi:hypothetical protein